MRRIILFTAVWLLLSCPCFSDTPYALFVENGHWIYDALHILSVESGTTTLADRQPLSKGELAEYFSAFDHSAVPQASEPLYKAVQDYFLDHPFLVHKKYFYFDINTIFALQGQYIYGRENEVRFDRFMRYNRTPAVISVPMQVLFTPYINFFVDFGIKKNFWASELSYPYLNLPLSASAVDMSMPQRAGVTVGGRYAVLTIGRGPLTIGRSLSGSMLLADTVDRLDYIAAAVFYKNVRLSLTVAELEPTRFLFSHEASFRPLHWISVRLYEGIVLNAPFDPKYLNPMMIFHNYTGWREATFNSSSGSTVGCQLGIGFDAVPVRGLRIYGQYGQNQFQTSYELNHFPNARNIPNSLGGLAGVEYTRAFSFGHLSVTGEFLYANPWMYIMENKRISLYYKRKDPVAPSGKTGDDIMIWLANPYGPDTIGGFLQLSLTEPKRYSAKLGYRFLAKGENEANFFNKDKETSADIYYPPTDTYSELVRAKTPSGTPAYFHTVALEGAYTVVKNVELNGALSWTVASGKKKGHVLSLSAGITYTIR